MHWHERFAAWLSVGYRRSLCAALVLSAAVFPAAAQDRYTQSDLAGVVFPEASRSWDDDPEGAKAATLDLAASYFASECGPTEFHVWQSVNETPDEIRQKTDDAFIAAGWRLATISRTDEGGRIHLASRGIEQLIMTWEPTPGAMGLLLCEVGGSDEAVAAADPGEPEAAGDAQFDEEEFADPEPRIAEGMAIPRPRPGSENEAPLPAIELRPEVLAEAVADAAATDPAEAEAQQLAALQEDLPPNSEPAIAAEPLPEAGPVDVQAAPPPKSEDRLPVAVAATEASPGIDREFTAALTPADADAVTPATPLVEPGIELPETASQRPPDSTALGDIIAQSAVGDEIGTDAVAGSASVATSGIAWRAALLVLALALVSSSLWMLRRREPVGPAPAIRGWPKAIATVIDSRVEADGPDERSSRTRYVPVVEYEFEAGGEVYRGERVRLGDNATHDRALAEEVVSRYPAWAGVEVRFDPDDPANAILEVEEAKPDMMLAAGIAAAAVALLTAFVALVL